MYETKLDTETLRTIEDLHRKWEKIAFSTCRPFDSRLQNICKSAFYTLYKNANLTVPTTFVWVKSPLMGQLLLEPLSLIYKLIGCLRDQSFPFISEDPSNLFKFSSVLIKDLECLIGQITKEAALIIDAAVENDVSYSKHSETHSLKVFTARIKKVFAKYTLDTPTFPAATDFQDRLGVDSVIHGILRSLGFCTWEEDYPKGYSNRFSRFNSYTSTYNDININNRQLLSGFPPRPRLLPVAASPTIHGIDYTKFDWLDYLTNNVRTPTRLIKCAKSLIKLAHICGGWKTYDTFVMVLEKPIHVTFDNQDQFHNESDAAIKYQDGFGYYLWHGINVPKKVITHPEDITPEEINEETNVEVRRIMLERLGMELFVKKSKATIKHQDHYGTLYEIPAVHIREENIVTVSVKNSTPEPDGSYKTYFLRVPPAVKTAREAVAWTFGVENPKEYKPLEET